MQHILPLIVLSLMVTGAAGNCSFDGNYTLSGDSNHITIPTYSGSTSNANNNDANTTTTTTTNTPTNDDNINVMSVTVGGSGLCGSTFNMPCVSVNICVANSDNCQTISDVLLDTGSYGLRLFRQAFKQNILQNLTPVYSSQALPVAECALFGTGACWGPLVYAGVQLAHEDAVVMPIQIINASYASVPQICGSVDQSPEADGFNGILGVGLSMYDCGEICAEDSHNETYFACHGDVCSNISLEIAKQIQNPVARLPKDNNGVVIKLPAVDSGSGASKIVGEMMLGIGTRSNNSPSNTDGVIAYPADAQGQFTTIFGNTIYNESFIDSGSNALYFTDAALGTCANNTVAAGFFCTGHAEPTALQAATQGYGQRSYTNIHFLIADADILLESNPDALVFSDVGGSIGALNMPQTFDWGLPFFLGRSVYVGFNNRSSAAFGTGPYWAY